MLKLLHAKRSQVIGCLAPLLVAYTPICSAQAGDCTAQVKIASMGVPMDDMQLRYRTTTLYRYRIDATTSEKQCAMVNFDIRRSYKLPDGSPFTAADPGSMWVHGGKGTDYGEIPGDRGLPKIQWAVENISCKKCQ